VIVAIDGPAGAGKSTVARGVAQRLGLFFLDTGAMYRAVALLALRSGVDPGSEDALTAIAREVDLTFDADGRIRIDGETGEPAIRSEEVTAIVSEVSAHRGVRDAVSRKQREMANGVRGLVAEGRDTTTAVFPRADYKFFLVASPRVRAERRARQLGTPQAVDAILEGIVRRDRLDSTRSHSPLALDPSACVIDSDGLSVDEVVGRIVDHVRDHPLAAPAAGRSTGGLSPEQGGGGAAEQLEDSGPPPTVLTRSTLVYRVGRALVVLFSRVWLRLRVEGEEAVPPSGGVVIVANHQSFLDIPVLGASIRRHIGFVARSTLTAGPGMGWFMRQCGTVLVERGKPNRRALDEMVAHLRQGDCLALFPEGTRSKDGRLQAFRGGAALVARRANVQIIPAGISGTYDAWPRHRRLPRRGRVQVRFGAPIDPQTPDALERAQRAVADLVVDPSR
jgi:cytidylate kinase